jgi:hypothetical protein
VKRHAYALTFILSLAAVPCGNVGAQTYVLDNFEASSLRIVQPNEPSTLKYLWNLNIGSGTTSVTTADKHDGTQSLRSSFAGGPEWQFQFYTYTEGLSGWSNGWKYMRRFVNNPSMSSSGGSPAWQTGKINRMRFWIKVPPAVTRSGSGDHNLELGTYLARSGSESSGETDNHHHYHKFNIGYSGQWEQLIVDTHPDHIRGANGDAEHPNLLFPYGDGNTYFDLLTRFYLHFPYSPPTGDYRIDGFELYQDTNPQNVDQVRSIHAVHIPGSNEVRVGWTRRKDQATVKHEVRYAFTDIFSTGWAGATVAPNGTVTPPGDGGFNTMSWSTTSLNLSGRSVLYVAIKPQNSSLFSQIAIPLGSGSSFPAPGNLRVIQ